MRRACWSWRWEMSRATGRAPCAVSQRAHWAAPAPISRTSLPLRSSRRAEQLRLHLVETLGAPHETVVAEERAVLDLVLVRVAVPPAAIGPGAFGDVGVTPGGLDGVRRAAGVLRALG